MSAQFNGPREGLRRAVQAVKKDRVDGRQDDGF